MRMQPKLAAAALAILPCDSVAAWLLKGFQLLPALRLIIIGARIAVHYYPPA